MYPFLFGRGRAKAEDCLQHPWLAEGDLPDPYASAMNSVQDNSQTGQSEEEEELKEESSPITSPSQVDSEEQTVTEELILMASYTLGQCRQTEIEKQSVSTAITKRFKFEEPVLQEIPGDFIY